MTSSERQQRRWERSDFRVICNCQVHARRERTLWRRSIRAARNLKAKGIALLVGVPLALGALQFPTEAMNITLGETLVVGHVFSRELPQAVNDFAIFTTPRIRNQFLEPAIQHSFTLD